MNGNEQQLAVAAMQAVKMMQAVNAMKALQVHGDSILVNVRFVVVRVGRTTWRLGELAGDWLCSGTAAEIAERAYR